MTPRLQAQAATSTAAPVRAALLMLLDHYRSCPMACGLFTETGMLEEEQPSAWEDQGIDGEE